MEEDKPEKNNKDTEENIIMKNTNQQKENPNEVIDETPEDTNITKNTDVENNRESEEEEETFELKLGQIIQFIAPKELYIDKQIFLIEYLDENKMKLINTNDLNILTLKIFEGEIMNVEIDNINILRQPTVEGYARQNDLLPHKWVSITFGGDIPQTINGEITDLENDQIQITTWPEKKLLWIDFEYKGIPENIPIVSIIPIEKPKSIKQDDETSELDENVPDVMNDTIKNQEESEEIDENQYSEEDVDDDTLYLNDTETSYNKEELFINVDDIIIGEKLDAVTEEVILSGAEKRYDITHQTDDLLNDLLSTIPTGQKTPLVLNKIHNDIERFKELRSMFLEFDESGSIKNTVMFDENHKPLAKSIKNGVNVEWILPITSNKHNIYNVEKSNLDEFSDIKIENTLLKVAENYDIIHNYNSNTIPDGKNKYHYLIQQGDNFQKPFVLSDDKTNKIGNISAKTPLYIVSDNIGNFNSNLIENKILNEYRFNIDIHLPGYKNIQNNTYMKFKNEPVHLSLDETYDLKGLLILPLTMAKKSTMNLPAQNLYTKVNMSQNIIMKYDFLNYMTNVKTINLLETDVLNDDYKLSFDFYEKDSIHELNFKEVVNYEDRDSNILNAFLNKTIPKTSDFIDFISKTRKDILSLDQLVDTLEIFHIYYKDFTLNDINSINLMLENNILDYKKENHKTENILDNYINTAKNVGNVLKPSLYFNLFPESGEEFSKSKEIFNKIYYDMSIEDNKNEFMSKIVHLDNGRLLLNALTLTELSLFQPVDVEEFMEEDLEEIQNTLTKKLDDDSCGSSIFLVKRYEDIDELLEDDYNINLKADKKYYNHVDFDIGVSWREKHPTVEGDENIINGITQHLIKNVKVSPSNALRDAETMFYGFMKVKEGDYALLDYGEERKYYRRTNNKWRINEEYDNKYIDEINFCNMKDKCLKVKNACNNMEANKDIIKQRLINEINDNFENKLRLSIDELKKKIVNEFNYNLENLKSLKSIKNKNYLKNNYQKYNLGFEYEDLELTVSPHANLRDIIISSNDLITKYYNIQRFAEKYCREPNDGENIFWLYCNESNIPLLPSFFIDLAIGFEKGEYNNAIDEVCKVRGVLSNDGDKFVDKYSGYYITNVSFSNDEGYTEEGYKINTKSLIEKDITDIFNNANIISADYKYNTELSITIKNTLENLDKLLNISTIKEHDFIIKHVTQYLLENLNEKDYKKN